MPRVRYGQLANLETLPLQSWGLEDVAGLAKKILQIRSLLKREQIPPSTAPTHPSGPPNRFVFRARELLQCLCVARVGDEALVAAGQSAYYEAYFRRAVAVVLDGVGLVG